MKKAFVNILVLVTLIQPVWADIAEEAPSVPDCPPSFTQEMVCHSDPKDLDHQLAVKAFDTVILCRQAKATYMVLTVNNKGEEQSFAATKITSGSRMKFQFKEPYQSFQIIPAQDNSKFQITYQDFYSISSTYQCGLPPTRQTE